ncbi:MAG: hypothetical protein QOH97_460 [Actinoplanes sp.]|nr:hypothetical protein [Actinoplanes sp.]
MRTPRLAGLGLGMMAAVALAVTGCGAKGGAVPGAGATASGTPGTPASSSAADPAAVAALASAAAVLSTQTFTVTMTAGPGIKLTAHVDVPGAKGAGNLAITGSNTDIQVKSLLTGQDLYVQVPGVTKAGTWTHLDVARLPEGANVGVRPGQIDPINTQKVLTSTTDVQQADARSYHGTLDLTEVTGITGVDPTAVTMWGAAAKNVPFTAGLDDQGRLSVLTVTLPAAGGQPAQVLDVTYTDYGIPVTADKPAPSEIIEAPASLYKTLGG